MVAHTGNPSYLGSREWEDCGSKPVQAKVRETPISVNKARHSGKITGGIGRRITVGGQTWAKSMRLHVKNNFYKAKRALVMVVVETLA
jgi:hypothetical protein